MGWVVSRRACFAWLACSMAACTARGDAPAQDESTSGTSAAGESTTDDSETTASLESSSSHESTSGTTQVDSADSGSGGIDLACPQPTDVIGAVQGISLGRAWSFEGESGTSDAICSAIDYDGELLQLECVRVDADDVVHAAAIRGGGPIFADTLAAIVGMDELRLSVAFSSGFFPGLDVSHFTLRSSAGELLVLDAFNGQGPGSPVVNVDVEGWTTPFDELALVDPGCPVALNPEPDTWPDSWLPFALEIGTAVPAIFQGQQVTVELGGSSYEVSVTRARTLIEVCADCLESEAAFSIVRRL